MARLIRQDRRGSVALEAALAITLVLAPLVFGAVGAGQFIATQVRLDRALHAAMLFAWATPSAGAAAIRTAAIDGYGAGTPALTASAVVACTCMLPAGTRQAGTPVNCAGTCGTGMIMATHVTTTLSATVAVNLPGVPNKTLTASGTARLQ